MSRASSQSAARLGVITCIAVGLGLAGATPASGATTIGQLAPGTPAISCTIGPTDAMQATVASGNDYVVPPGGIAITSWSTNAALGDGQQLKMKVFRRIGETNSFTVVGHDGPRALTPGVVNTFQTNVPVQPGDLLALNDQNASNVPNACGFDAPGEMGRGKTGDLPDGATGTFLTFPTGTRLNISAVVGVKASNEFNVVKVKKNKRKGTATLLVDVPGPGALFLSGTGVKAQRTGGATTSKRVTEAGKVKLRVKAKGRKKKKLFARGKVKVKVKVTFRPSAVNGDVAGDPNTERKKIKLVDKG